MNPERNASAVFTGQEVVVHNYRYFYYLANEMAYHSTNEKEAINSFRYAMGTVIFSFTTIEVFVNHVFLSDEYKVSELLTSMSDELKKKIEWLDLREKIEFILMFHPNSKVRKINRGEEPFQSFDLLRELRNFLIHYKPKEEVVYSTKEEYLNQMIKLEKSARSKFKINDATSGDPIGQAFVYRCFNKDCALWAFDQVQPFLDWLCDALDINRHTLKKEWQLPSRA